ncbi:Asp-tRNA(Asn)/Glu-tRNA(Gln) amidotransferase GatCAB subunit B, partial [Gemmatimonadota bacterium]
VDLLEEGTISQPAAKEIFAEMVENGTDPRVVVQERGLEKVTDERVLLPLVEKVLEALPEKVKEYRDGKKGLFGLFTGQIMKETQGRADPRVVQDLLRERLDS